MKINHHSKKSLVKWELRSHPLLSSSWPRKPKWFSTSVVYMASLFSHHSSKSQHHNSVNGEWVDTGTSAHNVFTLTLFILGSPMLQSCASCVHWSPEMFPLFFTNASEGKDCQLEEMKHFGGKKELCTLPIHPLPTSGVIKYTAHLLMSYICIS